MNMTIFTKTKKYMLIISICSLMLFPTGCWDRIEVNDLAIIVATGLDKTDDGQIELSVQLVNPKTLGGGQQGGSGQGSGQATTVEKTTGKTIFDARSKLQEQVSRKIFWGHNRIIIIGENMAKEGIRKHIDFFARHPFPRLRAFIFIAKDKATDILKINPELERSSAEVARELAKFKIGLSLTVKDLLQMLHSDAKGTALPLIEIENEPSNTMGLRANGTAIFKVDKMIGQIDNKLTRGLLWIRDEIELASITINPKDTKGNISFNLIRSGTELIPSIKNGKWKITVKITSELDAVENETKLNLMHPEVTKKLRNQLEQKIDERIHLTLDQVQKEMETDVFGFAEAFQRQYPKQWAKAKDQWHEIFPEIEVEIKNKVYIRRPGSSAAPPGVPDDEVIKK